MDKQNKKQHIHVALLDVFIGVLVHAVLLAALPVEPEEAAHGHPRLVVLMEEAAGVSLHAQAAQPVPAHRLPEAPPPQPRVAPHSALRCCACSRCGHVGVGGCTGGGICMNDVRPRRRGSVGSGTGVQAALEVEAENSLRVLH